MIDIPPDAPFTHLKIQTDEFGMVRTLPEIDGVPSPDILRMTLVLSSDRPAIALVEFAPQIEFEGAVQVVQVIPEGDRS